MGSKSVKVDKYPRCEIPGCNKEAHYDAQTFTGQWAYLCEQHFKEQGCELGLGKGQMLELREQAPPTRPQPWIDMEELLTQALDGIITCPQCGESLEPDADKCQCGWRNPPIAEG